MITLLQPIVILFLAMLALEFIFHLAAGLLGNGFFRAGLLCFMGAVFLGGLGLLMPEGAAFIVSLAVLAALTVLMMAQLIYYKVFYSFFTVYSMMNGGGAFQFVDTIFTAIRKNLAGLLALLLPFCWVIAAERLGLWSRAADASAPFLPTLSLLAVILGLQLILTVPLARDPSGKRALRWGQGDIKSSVSQVGLLTTMEIDLLTRIVKPSAAAALQPPREKQSRRTAAIPQTQNPSPAKQTLPLHKPAEAPPSAPWYGKYNRLDIPFDALKQADKHNESLTQLHNYFSALQPSAQNDHTGMFAGYNLIYLTCESFSHLAIDPKLTPTLHKLYTQGMKFENFYNPVWGVSTTDGEYVACLGMLPKPGVWSMYKSAGNALPFALGRQLSALGYQCRAYHNHSYSYYNRHKSHPNLGYDYKGLGGGLDLKKTWPESDLEMVEKTVGDYIGKEPFHTYYMTVSGHMNYSFTGNAMAAKHRDAVMDLPHSEPIKAYMATQIELDLAVECLLRNLEEAGVAERTLIVMVADHYPYGLTTAELSVMAGEPLDETFGIYKSGLLLYAKGMTPEVVSEPMFSPDVIPTLQNLMGLRFDSRFFSGRDVFSDVPPLVFTANRSFIAEGGRYDAKTKIFTPADNVALPDNYRETVSAVIEARFASASKVLDLDYFGRINSALADRQIDSREQITDSSGDGGCT